MRAGRGKRTTKAAALTLALCLAGASLAYAEATITQKGNVRVSVEGKLSPAALPRHGTAPVSVSVAGQIATVDGSSPPVLKQLKIEINRHGRIETRGLPVCRIPQIQPGSNAHALAACRSSLVGEGTFSGTVTLPGAAPYPIEGKLLLFNGQEHGRSVLLGHIYSLHPFATSFVIVFGISVSRHGQFGTTLTANLAKALGAKRNLTGLKMKLSRTYSYKGARHSYISAGCPAPKGFPAVSFPLARTSFAFADGTKLTSTLNRECKARG